MAGINEQLAELEKLINEKQKEILRKQNDIINFVDTKHKAKATLKYQQEVRDFAKEINDFIILLIETKEGANEHKELAEKLCGSGIELNSLTKDLSQALANDLAERRHEEAIDIVKIAGVVGGLATAAVTVSKYTFDPQSSHAVAEISVGATIGLTSAFWKPILSAFTWAGKQVCSTPKRIKNNYIKTIQHAQKAQETVITIPEKIRNSFAIYYLRESFRLTHRQLLDHSQKNVKPTSKVVNDNKRKTKRGNTRRKGRSSGVPKP